MKPARYLVQRNEEGHELLDFLTGKLKTSRNRTKRYLDARNVFVNQRRVWMAHHRLHAGDQVEIAAAPAEAPGIDQKVVLHQDEHLVIANKPAGILSNGDASLEAALRAKLGAPDLVAVHRLDRDTSGCLILARNTDVRDRMIPLFESRAITKAYHVLALGRPAQKEFSVSRPIDDQPAETRFRVVDSNPIASHILAKIETGRTHQIRRHLEGMGHPVLGDRMYGTRLPMPADLRRLPRQMLHAYSLTFRHPVSGETVHATAPLPADFRSCMKRLKLT